MDYYGTFFLQEIPPPPHHCHHPPPPPSLSNYYHILLFSVGERGAGSPTDLTQGSSLAVWAATGHLHKTTPR